MSKAPNSKPKYAGWGFALLMTRSHLLIAFLFWSVSTGYSQARTPSQAPASPVKPGSAIKATPLAVFHSDLLDLSFTYPASLVAQKLPSLKEQHNALDASLPADTKPEDRKTNECTDKALYALRADDPKNQSTNIVGDQPGAGTAPHPITGNILISRIGVDCMPAAYRNQLDNMATAMSAALAQDRGLHPIDRPIWYEIDNTRVHFAAGESVPPANQAGATSAPSPKSRWVGSAAIVWNGNLVSIVIESNDISFFNEMLHSRIGLGKATPAPLFPADIGKGKPIEAKP